MKGPLNKASGRRCTEPYTHLWHGAHQPESAAQIWRAGVAGAGRTPGSARGWRQAEGPRGRVRSVGFIRHAREPTLDYRVTPAGVGSVDWEGGRRGGEDTQQRAHVTVTHGAAVSGALGGAGSLGREN